MISKNRAIPVVAALGIAGGALALTVSTATPAHQGMPIIPTVHAVHVAALPGMKVRGGPVIPADDPGMKVHSGPLVPADDPGMKLHGGPVVLAADPGMKVHG